MVESKPATCGGAQERKAHCCGSFRAFLDKTMSSDWIEKNESFHWNKTVKKQKELGLLRWLALGLVVLSLVLYWRALRQRNQARLRTALALESRAALDQLREVYDRWVERSKDDCAPAVPYEVRCDASLVRMAVVRPFSTKHISLLERRISDWTTLAHAAPCLSGEIIKGTANDIVPDLVFVYSASRADHEAHGEEFRERLMRAAEPLSPRDGRPSCFRKILFWKHIIDRRLEDVHPDATCGMFYDLIERLAAANATDHEPYTHFLLMEPDVQPLQAGWLSKGMLPLACMAAVDGSWMVGSISRNPMDYRDYHLNGNALYAVQDKAFRQEYLGDHVRRRYRRSARVPFAEGCSGTSFGGFDVSISGYLFDLPMSRDEWHYVATIYHRFRATDAILNMGNTHDWRPWSNELEISCRTMLVHGKSANRVRNLWDPTDAGWFADDVQPNHAASNAETYRQISLFLDRVSNTTDPYCRRRICDPTVPFPPRAFTDWIRKQLEAV